MSDTQLEYVKRMIELINTVVPDGMTVEQQEQWTYAFIEGAVQDRVAHMSQQPTEER